LRRLLKQGLVGLQRATRTTSSVRLHSSAPRRALNKRAFWSLLFASASNPKLSNELFGAHFASE